MSRMSLAYEGNVAVLKFNHPEVMNAIGAQMLDDFADALLDIEASDARAVLLTGEGRGFCAGANLQDDSGRKRRGGAGYGLRSTYHPLLLALRDMDKAIVTAVNGAPGARSSIRIRGGNSINADNEPLYVIDGVIVGTGMGGFERADDSLQTYRKHGLSKVSPFAITQSLLLAYSRNNWGRADLAQSAYALVKPGIYPGL